MIIVLTIVLVLLFLILFASLYRIKTKAIYSKNKVNDSNEAYLSKEKIESIKEKFKNTQNLNIKVNEVTKKEIEEFYRSQLEEK